jgi:hypothetical protein
MNQNQARTPRLAAKLGLAILAVALLGPAAAIGTWSAFSAVTSNPGNTFEAGTVVLCDNDTGSPCVNGTPMFALPNMDPGDSDMGCIKVSYSGTLTSRVRLYGTTGGTGLDQYLDLKVTRGTYTPSEPLFDSCTNFSADSTNYIGAGPGVIYNGTLQGYPDCYEGCGTSGLVDPAPATPEDWTNPESQVYKFEITLQSNAPNDAQGKTATQTFTWEARNPDERDGAADPGRAGAAVGRRRRSAGVDRRRLVARGPGVTRGVRAPRPGRAQREYGACDRPR